MSKIKLCASTILYGAVGEVLMASHRMSGIAVSGKRGSAWKDLLLISGDVGWQRIKYNL